MTHFILPQLHYRPVNCQLPSFKLMPLWSGTLERANGAEELEKGCARSEMYNLKCSLTV